MPGSVQDPESRQGWGKVLAFVESSTVKRKAHSKDTEKHEHLPWVTSHGLMGGSGCSGLEQAGWLRVALEPRVAQLPGASFISENRLYLS